MSESVRLQVPPEYVVDVLCRTELGKALWQSAQFEALAEIQHTRIAELEKQKAPAASDPDTDGG